MPITGQKLVANNIIKIGGGFLATVDKTMQSVRKILDDKVTENISLTDHSIQDLRRLGHPYAARHGSKGLSLHEPYYQVHAQSGRLLSSKRSGTVKASVSKEKLTAIAYVGLDQSVAKHALFVIFGTSKMIPRPALEGSRLEVLKESQKLIREDLKNLIFSFKG